jgi:hypothetical protein
MSRYLTDVWRFSDGLGAPAPGVTAPALLSRAVLEDHLLWVRRESDWKPATCSHRAVALRSLLDEQAEDGLPGLPRGAVIHRAELPRVDYRLPKPLRGEVAPAPAPLPVRHPASDTSLCAALDDSRRHREEIGRT